MSVLAAVALVTAAGVPLAYLVTRSLPLAVLVAPLAAAGLATVAVLLMLIAGGGVGLWCGVVLAANAAGLWWWHRRGPAPALPHGGWRSVAALAGPQLPPFVLAVRPAIDWDAHSIWWLHAAFLSRGGGFARDAIGNPAYAFSHPDYPPLASAPVAAVWTVLPGYDFRVAQAVTVTLTVAAVCLLAYAVRTVTSAAPALVSWGAATLVGYAAWGLAPESVASGVSDVLWSAAFCAAAVLLLVGPAPLDRPALPLLLLGVAALTKNEGFLMSLVVAVLVTLRYRHRLRRVAVVWLPVAAGVLWSLLARALGASSDLASGARTDELLDGRLDVAGRLATIASAMVRETGTAVLLAGLVAVVGAVFLRRPRRAAGLGGDHWLWLAALAYTGLLTAVYLVTPTELTWHLRTSLSRVLLPVVLLAGASAVVWVAVALRRPDPPDPVRPDPAAVPERAPDPAAVVPDRR